MTPSPLQTARPHVIAGLVLAALLAAGCDVKKPEGGGAAARVDGDDITVLQINQLIAPRNLRPEQADAAGRQVLERLIDQQLAMRKARDADLEREPRVQLLLEAARREVLARVYLDQVADRAARPTADEIKRHYDEKPALYGDRRVYSLQEIGIDARPEQVPALRERLSAARNLNEFFDYLRENGMRFGGAPAVRGAEFLPPASLEAVTKMRDGQALLITGTSGVQVVVLLGSSPQPLTLEQARPRIEQTLMVERRRKLVEEELASLRKAARIEYFGRFAEGSRAGAAAAAAASAAAEAASR